MRKIQDLATGHWPSILSSLGGLTQGQLENKHQPCPLCDGKDRYRFDDHNGTGSWYCNQCGGRDQQGGGGTGMDLLMRLKNWDFKTAVAHVERHLGVETRPPRDRPQPKTRGAEAVYHYTDDFIVCRFIDSKTGEKKIRPQIFDPKANAWKFGAPPAPRPIYNLDGLAARPDATVLIVEGEKAADAAKKLFADQVVTTWPSGCKAWAKADWSPIQGRDCILWPDADDAGINAMNQLGPHLLSQGATEVYTVAPPPNAPKGWDVADSIWSPEEAVSYLLNNLSLPLLPPEPEEEPETDTQSPEELDSSVEADLYFACLGFQDNTYFYQPTSTGQVVALHRASHSGVNLCALAPLEYWENLYPTKSGVNWTAAASSLFQRCHSVGFYDPDKLRGRGAWWDNGRSVLHLGNRIIVDGETVPSTKPLSNSEFYYQRLIKLKGPDMNNPLSTEEAEIIMRVANSFLWETPVSGMLLTGWIVLAPVCGILNWRPHAWLTAGSGSGKSTVLEKFVMPLLGDMLLPVTSNTTEAGIRQRLKADALPVLFDEAESNERADQQRIQSILGLARVSSFESDATILKGSADGTMQHYKIRSMFMFSSIATALKQGADRSRFAQLTLRNAKDVLGQEERDRHWKKLIHTLNTKIDIEMGRRLQSRTFSLIPVIRKSIEVFTDAASEYFDGSRRDGDQYGTLLAGAWSLGNDEAPTREEAMALISSQMWEPHRQVNETPDEQFCIEKIMQHEIKVETDTRAISRTIGELVDIAASKTMDRALVQSSVVAALGRTGIKVKDGRIFISNTSTALASILKDTQWASCWSNVLLRLPGSTRAGSVYFQGRGSTARAVSVPLDSL